VSGLFDTYGTYIVLQAYLQITAEFPWKLIMVHINDPSTLIFLGFFLDVCIM